MYMREDPRSTPIFQKRRQEKMSGEVTCMFPEYSCAECIKEFERPPCYLVKNIHDWRKIKRMGFSTDLDAVTVIEFPSKLRQALVQAWGEGNPTLASARMKLVLIETIVKNERLRKAMEQGCLFVW